MRMRYGCMLARSTHWRKFEAGFHCREEGLVSEGGFPPSLVQGWGCLDSQCTLDESCYLNLNSNGREGREEF